MSVVDPSTLSIGQTIRFKTLNPHDNQYWTGKISAIADYDIARRMEDIDSYYQDILRSGRTIGAKETLKYLLLQVTEQDLTTLRVFATAFIDLSTLSVVDENTYRLIKIYDIDDNKALDVLEMIQSNGYIAEIYQE